MTFNIAHFTSIVDNAMAHSSSKTLCVAVSGGRDSMALLHALKALGQYDICALTVDHGLRQEAADEAEVVAKFCKDLGIAHKTLVWEHDEKPDSAIQEQAREKRYELMSGAMDTVGSNILFLGHQLDDQIETFWMRLQRGSGLKGLCAMRLLSVRGDKFLARPFLDPELDMTRDTITAYCEKNEIDFIDDPSNQNDDFERVRVRETLGKIELDKKGVLRSVIRLQAQDQALDQRVDQYIGESVTFDKTLGTAIINFDITDQGEPFQVRVFDYVLSMVGGVKDHLSRQKLDDFIDRLAQEETLTLGHCLVQKQDKGWCIQREQRHLPEPVNCPASGLWDGRFDVTVDTPQDNWTIQVVQDDDINDILDVSNQSYERDQLMVLPAIYVDNQWAVLPSLGIENPKLGMDFLNINFRFNVIPYFIYQGRIVT